MGVCSICFRFQCGTPLATGVRFAKELIQKSFFKVFRKIPQIEKKFLLKENKKYFYVIYTHLFLKEAAHFLKRLP